MGTIYLTQHGMKVNKKGGRFVVTLKDIEIQSIPAEYVENVVVMGTVQLTHAVLMDILDRGWTVTYLSSRGEIKGTLGIDVQQGRQVLEQAAANLDEKKRLHVANGIISRKIKAQRGLLQRYNKSLQSELLKSTAERLKYYAQKAEAAENIKQLLGIEGTAAKEYYDCYPDMLKSSSFTWQGRNRRPPKDPVNALLSFAYTILEREVKLAIMQSGLTTGIGFVHGVNDYKDGFVYDVMEPFRSMAAERFVFRCINRRLIKQEDFDFVDGDACYLSATGRRKFIAAYEGFNDEKNFNGKELQEAIKEELLLLRKAFAEQEEENF